VLARNLLTYSYAEKYSFTALLNNNEEMIMLKKTLTIIGLTAAMTLSAAANAVAISGTITGGTGALLSLVPLGTVFVGELDWNGGASTLDGGQVLLGGFCFTDDASGLPPTSPTCGALSAVPLLNNTGTPYDGTNQPGPYQQAGTTYDGTSGLLNILAFSPTFNVNIPISLDFAGDGTGTLLADAGALGTSTGVFDVAAIPVPAAAWLFGSALLGLAGIKRRKLAA
jgi:hypothetical protein